MSILINKLLPASISSKFPGHVGVINSDELNYSELIKATQPFGYDRMKAELLMLSIMVFKIILW